MTIKQNIQTAIKKGQQENYKIRNTEAKRILRHILGMSAEQLIVHSNDEVPKQQEMEFKNQIKELINGKPLQYITNTQPFYGRDFYVNENVLIPQPDTEIVVEKTIEVAKNMETPIQILDLCTGSGAIAISIKAELGEDVEVTATDISLKALEVAKINEKKILKQNQKIKFIQSDMFENIIGKFDIIVSNPPYIESEEIKKLDKDVQNEPMIALDGGEDGLKFYRIISQNKEKFLKTYGKLIMEIGYNQRTKLQKLFPNAKCIQDYAGNDRIIIA